MMLQKAKELGIPTDKVNDDMMLVRVMSPVHTYEDARKLGAFGQKSSALPMTEVEEARSFQNAQRLKFGLNLNLTGIGRRSINEKNVGNFIRNNPQVYQKILKLSGYDPIAVQYRPAEQAKVVNTALLAQLDKDFIRTVSRKGEDTHELVKVTAPIIADNQKDIADGTVPPNGDIQKFLKNSIEQYDSLSSATKNLLKVDKNGAIPFLETGDEGRKNPDSLISRMRQEAIEFGDKKSGNIFRNPLNVIGLVAYHQAMTPRDPDKKDQARELFALKMKRFADAMKTLKEKGEQGADIFAAQLSPEQQTAQQQEDIIKIAERVFLENKPYREENAEEMTAEEKEAGKETYSAFNAYKKMKDVAKEFEFSLEHHKLQKSLLGYFFKSRINKYIEEIDYVRVKHFIGETKQENGVTYILQEETIGSPRWHKVEKVETPKRKNISEDEAKQIYYSIGKAKHEDDGKVVEFVRSIWGKIKRYQEQSLLFAIMPDLKTLFEKSLYIYSEEDKKHEKHPTLWKFHNYLSITEIDGNEYYVRFTTQEPKRSKEDQLHNVYISDVKIIKAALSRHLPGLSAPTILQTLLAALNDPKKSEQELEPLRKKFIAHPARKRLQEEFAARVADRPQWPGAVWFLCDPSGVQMTRVPETGLRPTLGGISPIAAILPASATTCRWVSGPRRKSICTKPGFRRFTGAPARMPGWPLPPPRWSTTKPTAPSWAWWRFPSR